MSDGHSTATCLPDRKGGSGWLIFPQALAHHSYHLKDGTAHTAKNAHTHKHANSFYFLENSIRSEHFWCYTLFNSIHATTGLIINVCSAGNNSHSEKMLANICSVKIFCKQKVEQQTANTHSDSHLALVGFLSRFSVICNTQGSPLLLCLTDDYPNCSVHVYVSRWLLAWFFWGMSHVTGNKVKWNWPQQIKRRKNSRHFKLIVKLIEYTLIYILRGCNWHLAAIVIPVP